MMRRRRSKTRLPKRLAAVLGVIVLTTLAFLLPRAEISGPATVVDGDTLHVQGETIRLYGIDAPEAKQTCHRHNKQVRCGREATEALKRLIQQRPVRCLIMETDKYDRAVARCEVEGQSLNAVMVRSGQAVAYYQYGGWVYGLDELQARRDRAGLWASRFQEPSAYRRAKRHQ